MKKTCTACSIGWAAALGLAASALIWRKKCGCPRHGGPGLMMRRIAHRLHLTEAQRDEIKTILAAERATILTLARRLRQEQEELQSQPFEESRVRQFAKDHAATMEDALVEREQIRERIAQVLTPEQRARGKQMRQEMAERFFSRLEKMGDWC